jgi:hypothetical protein
MDEIVREIGCKAWRLLLQHGDHTGSLIDSELNLKTSVQSADYADKRRFS